MKILAIDSSGLVASAAIWEGNPGERGCILAVSSTDYKKTHSQTLLPMIDSICKETSCEAKDFDAVAISAGPGSFTGLRIGSATAKAIAMAAEAPVIEVPTLSGLAFNLWGSGSYVCPMMDARRDQVYTALYSFKSGKLITHIEGEAVSVDEMIDRINSLGKEVIFLGDGADAYRQILESKVTVPYLLAPAHLNRQSAASVAVLGSVLFAEGKTVNADDHSPTYLRVSQAEREGAKNFDLRK
ncbi:MAG: tRNA (adenosine(37)-N6)-threonylcarbamoyltransferase complex dimerization subunit type 1 TsaB [Lachnospiraceae bacterium]|nr:tRNA (adenosine(37)-N6)-threonylcarbamoyltransferase complex dimerization subunit type 1 TsaB [Lachnospiraceae bacterium]